MQIKNPFLHYECFSAMICKKDGERFWHRGTSAATLDLLVDEEDVKIIVLEALDSTRTVCDARMLVDGIWAKVDEDRLEKLLAPPEPEEVEVEVEVEAEFQDEVGYELERSEDEPENEPEDEPEDEEDYEDEEDSRFGLGCS